MLLVAEHHLSPSQTGVSEVYSVIFWAIFINCCFNTGYPSNTGQMIPILRNDELRWMFDEQELLFAGMLLVEAEHSSEADNSVTSQDKLHPHCCENLKCNIMELCV